MASKLYIRLSRFFTLTFLLYLIMTLLSSNNSMHNINMSLKDAFSLYNEGKLLIIDVRTETEWKSTGIIPKSKLISMHDTNYNENKYFIDEVKLLLDNNNNNKKVSFICASGARSEIVANYFYEKGYKNIYHIPEGVVGANYNGWVYEGLPIISYDDN